MNNNKKKILLISRNQFGYLIDYMYYYEYLSKNYDVQYICMDSGKPKINHAFQENIQYTPYNKYKMIRAFIFLCEIVFGIFKKKYDYIILLYFPYCRFLSYFNRNIILDIRTLSVDKDEKIRKKANNLIIGDCRYFDRINVVSRQVKSFLLESLPNKIEINVIGLGGKNFKTKNKYIDGLKLLYVGTLTNRDVLNTVKYLQSYIEMRSEKKNLNVEYHIIGDGEDIIPIENYVYQNNLTKQVFIHGFKPQNELHKYYDVCNIGVAYVPRNDYYKYQPATKIYEYLSSNLFVIASNYSDLSDSINHGINGYEIDNTENDFHDALDYYLMNRVSIASHFDDTNISFTWEKVVYEQLMKVLK